MAHFITINWFNWIGVLIWNRFRVRLNWKIWRVKININIIKGMMIKYPHDSWNHRSGVGRRGSGFEVILWRLNVTLSWSLIYLLSMKGFELIHLSSKIWWKEFRSTYYSGIRLVSNPSTVFANTILSHTEIWNNWLERWCIIVDGRRRTEMMIELTWSGLFFGAPIIYRLR